MAKTAKTPRAIARKASAAEVYRQNRTAILARNKTWRDANKERMKFLGMRWMEKNRDARTTSCFAYSLQQKFGITLEYYDRLFEAQGGVCAVCGRPETIRHQSGAVARLCVDHDHTTGEVRGLLCRHCNLALGYLRDDPEIIARAADYVLGAKRGLT